ncbi:MAG: NAD(+) diphosphatase [Actinomycetota bacterium]
MPTTAFVPMVTTAELDAVRPRVGETARWFVIDERANVLVVDGAIPMGDGAPVEGGVRHLLGVDGDTPVWAVGIGGAAEVPEDAAWIGLRQLFGSIDDQLWALAGRAVQVVAWDRDHRFCSRCATETEPHPRDRAKRCPACGLMSYPRLTPAVIVLVERDDGRALLAWGRQFPGRFFSALAGFVEPGESLEECVVREVGEEVGIEIDDVRYFGSQPWPFPHSLMVGFNARYVSGDLTPQESEIVEAGWYRHDDLPPAPKGGMSIAGWLIDDWVTRSS